MRKRRDFLRGLLSGGAAVAAATLLPAGILAQNLSPEELEEALRVQMSVSEDPLAGTFHIEVFNPHMHTVEVRGTSFGVQRHGELYLSRIEIVASDGERTIWTR